jgi:hypothetical protein
MEPLLEQRLHRGGGQVAAADKPLVSLNDGGGVKQLPWSASSPDSIAGGWG